MSTLDAALRVARGYPGGVDALAQRLDKSPHTLRHELTGDGTAKLGLLDAELITVFAQQAGQRNALAVLQAFAGACGQMVLPLPECLALHSDDCFRGLADAAREFACLCDEVSGVLADGKVNDNELRRVVRAGGNLMASLHALLAALAARNLSGNQGGVQ